MVDEVVKDMNGGKDGGRRWKIFKKGMKDGWKKVGKEMGE